MKTTSMGTMRNLIFGVLLLGLGINLQASTMYTITNLGILPGDIGSGATAVNNAGQVVGGSFGNIVGRPFRWQGGVMTAIPGVANGTAFDINNSGNVVGYDSNASSGYFWNGSTLTTVVADGSANALNDNNQVVGTNNAGSGTGFSWLGGVLTTLPNPGSANGGPDVRGINNNGVITGSAYRTSSLSKPPVYWASATANPTDLGFGTPAPTPGGAGQGEDVNDAGTVVGVTPILGGFRAFRSSGGVMTTMGTLGGDFSAAYGINAGGVIVGASTTSGFSNHRAFVDEGTGLIDLNTVLINGAGWVLTAANDINDLGWIAGEGTLNGERRAFLLVPDASEVPEPGTWAMLSLGAVLLAVKRRQG